MKKLLMITAAMLTITGFSFEALAIAVKAPLCAGSACVGISGSGQSQVGGGGAPYICICTAWCANGSSINVGSTASGSVVGGTAYCSTNCNAQYGDMCPE
jgi:hypothetical protein